MTTGPPPPPPPMTAAPSTDAPLPLPPPLLPLEMGTTAAAAVAAARLLAAAAPQHSASAGQIIEQVRAALLSDTPEGDELRAALPLIGPTVAGEVLLPLSRPQTRLVDRPPRSHQRGDTPDDDDDEEEGDDEVEEESEDGDYEGSEDDEEDGEEEEEEDVEDAAPAVALPADPRRAAIAAVGGRTAHSSSAALAHSDSSPSSSSDSSVTVLLTAERESTLHLQFFCQQFRPAAGPLWFQPEISGEGDEEENEDDEGDEQSSMPPNPFVSSSDPESHLAWSRYFDADFAAHCRPLMSEATSLDAANRRWDSLLKCHRDAGKQVRAVHILAFLVGRVYAHEQFGVRAPIAFHSFCAYGLPTVTRWCLVSSGFTCPVNEDRSARFGAFRFVFLFLHLCQSVALRLLESTPLSTHAGGLFDTIELTLGGAPTAPVMHSWHRDLKHIAAEDLRGKFLLAPMCTRQLLRDGAAVDHLYRSAAAIDRHERSERRTAHQAELARQRRLSHLQQASPVAPLPSATPSASALSLTPRKGRVVANPGDTIMILGDEEESPQPGQNILILPRHAHTQEEDDPRRPRSGIDDDDVDDDAAAHHDEVQEVHPRVGPRTTGAPSKLVPYNDSGSVPSADDDDTSSVGGRAASPEPDANGDDEDQQMEDVEEKGDAREPHRDADEARKRAGVSAPPAGVGDDDVALACGSSSTSSVSVGSASDSHRLPTPTELELDADGQPDWSVYTAVIVDAIYTNNDILFGELTGHFLMLNGWHRLIQMIERDTTQTATSTPTTESSASPTADTSGEGQTTPPTDASPTAAAAAATKPTSSAAADFPPIIFTAFADRTAVMPRSSPSLLLLRRICSALKLTRSHVSRSLLVSLVLVPLFQRVAPRIQYLTEQQIRSESMHHIGDTLQVWTDLFESCLSPSSTATLGSATPTAAARDSILLQSDFDQLECELAVRLLRSTYLEKRILGLKWLIRIADRKPEKSPLSGRTAAQLLVRHAVIELLFGEQLHIQLVKRASTLLAHIAFHDELSAAHIESMWSASRGKHETVVAAIYATFVSIAQKLKSKPAVYLYRRIYDLPISEWDSRLVGMIRETTRELLGNYAAQPLWAHSHAQCKFDRMRALWLAHQQDKKARAHALPSAQTIASQLPSLPGVGVPPNEMGETRDTFELSHSSCTPEKPWDDFPPGVPYPFDEVTREEYAADDVRRRVRTSIVEYFGIDLLWRGFNTNGPNAISEEGDTEEAAEGARSTAPLTATGDAATALSLTAALRHECFLALTTNVLCPFFEDPRPCCARRMEFMMLGFKNLQRRQNVFHSLQLMRDLIQLFSSPSPSEKTPPNAVGRRWDDRTRVVRWLQDAKGLVTVIFDEIEHFGQRLARRMRDGNNSLGTYSLAFWHGHTAQITKRLEFLSFVFQHLQRDAGEEIHEDGQPITIDDEPSAQSGRPDATSPPVPSLVPLVSSTPPSAAAASSVPPPPSSSASTPAPAPARLHFLQYHHISLLFSSFLLPSLIPAEVRDAVFRWLSECLSSGLLTDELVTRIFDELIAQLDFARLTPFGCTLMMQTFLHVNTRANKIALKKSTASRAHANVHARRLASLARASAVTDGSAGFVRDEFRVVSSPVCGIDLLWRGALFAQDQSVSTACMHQLIRCYANIDAESRDQISRQYEEFVARCMRHVHDCTSAIESRADGDVADPSSRSIVSVVSDLHRVFHLLNLIFTAFDGVKPLSHEAAMRQAANNSHRAHDAADDESSRPIAAAGARAGEVSVRLRHSSLPDLRLRLTLRSSVHDLLTTIATCLHPTKVAISDIVILSGGARFSADDRDVTIASLNIVDEHTLTYSVRDLTSVLTREEFHEAAQRMLARGTEVGTISAGDTTAESVAQAKIDQTFLTATSDANLSTVSAHVEPPSTHTPGTSDAKEQEEKHDDAASAVVSTHPSSSSSSSLPRPASSSSSLTDPAAADIRHPTEILSRPQYFDQLFALLSLRLPADRTATMMIESRAHGELDAARQINLLAEQCWKLLMQLPTNAHMLRRLQQLRSAPLTAATPTPTDDGPPHARDSDQPIEWDTLLPSDNLHKLHYSLQIVYAIMPHHRSGRRRSHRDDQMHARGDDTTSVAESSPSTPSARWDADAWETNFVARGGLRHLVRILVETEFSSSTDSSPSRATGHSGHIDQIVVGTTAATNSPIAPPNQQSLECLALLLKIVMRFAPPAAPQSTNRTDEASASSHAVSAAAAVVDLPTIESASAGSPAAAKKRKADILLAASPPKKRAHSHLAASPIVPYTFASELQGVFTFDVAQKLFALWQEVAAKSDSEQTNDRLDTANRPSARHDESDHAAIGPKTAAAAAAAAATFTSAANLHAAAATVSSSSASSSQSDVLSEIAHSTLQLLRVILARRANSAIARRFFFSDDAIIRRWMMTLLTAPRRDSMQLGQAQLIAIAHYWSGEHADDDDGDDDDDDDDDDDAAGVASVRPPALESECTLRHLSRHLFHIALHFLLDAQFDDAIVAHRLRSSHFMSLPLALLADLRTELIATAAPYEHLDDAACEEAVRRWSVTRLARHDESHARTLQIDVLQLVDQLSHKLRSYPHTESFGDSCFDESLIGYIGLIREIVDMITAKPLIATDATTTLDALAPPATLPPPSPLSAMITRRRLIPFVYSTLLFDVPPIRTPLDVPRAHDAPRCKHIHTRSCAFALLRQLSVTDWRNYLQLQQCAIRSQRTGRGEEINFSYQPEAMKKRHGNYVGLVNQGATCYMNSLMQQLYMVPEFRHGILAQLSTDAMTDESQRADSLMYQMQAIFGHLMDSDEHAYDADGFCAAYKDWDGACMSRSVQMDVNEFFNVLFDKLESSLKGSPHADLLDHCFGGKLSNQLIGAEAACRHERERRENFYILSLDVKGKKTVRESLQSFVAGEMLEGDNKFLCSECDRKVDTLKRVCISAAPTNLILHLKRFEFDLDTMVKIKLNDAFEFPHELDIYEFTSEGIAAAEREKEREENANAESQETTEPTVVDRRLYTYELTGVIIHQGTAGSGHYYSYVRERCPLAHLDHSRCRPQWYCFNDSRVDPFDVSTLAETAFGGAVDENPFCMKPYSAYMLFYQRVDLEHTPHVMQTSEIPRHIANHDDMRAAKEAVCDQSPAHLPTAKETFDSMAAAAGLTVQDASQRTRHQQQHDDVMMTDPDSHKRKFSSAVAAATPQSHSPSHHADTDSLGLVAHHQSLCSSYRTRVATGPVTGLRRCLPSSDASALMPTTLFEAIWSRNVSLTHDSYQFDGNNLAFVWSHIVMFGCEPREERRDVRWTAGGDDDATDSMSPFMRIQLGSLELAVRFLLSTFVHAKQKSSVPSWESDLRRLLSASVPASRHFLDLLASEMCLCTIGLEHHLAPFKKSFNSCILDAIQCVRRVEQANYHRTELQAVHVDLERADDTDARDEDQPPQKRRRTSTAADLSHATDSHRTSSNTVEGIDDGDVDAPVVVPRLTSSVARFLDTLLSVSPYFLYEHAFCAGAWWQLLDDVCALGDAECEFLLTHRPTLLLAVQFLLGPECKVQPTTIEDPAATFKRQRSKRRVPVKPVIHLIARLADAASTNGQLDDAKMICGGETRTAFADEGFADFLCGHHDDLELVAPIKRILACICAGAPDVAAEVTQRIATAHVKEPIGDLVYSLEWLTVLMETGDGDASHLARVDLIADQLMQNLKMSGPPKTTMGDEGKFKYAPEVQQALVWATERMTNDNATTTTTSDLITSTFKSRLCRSRVLRAVPTWLWHYDPSVRVLVAAFLRAIADESPAEREERLQEEQQRAERHSLAARARAARAANEPVVADRPRQRASDEQPHSDDEEMGSTADGDEDDADADVDADAAPPSDSSSCSSSGELTRREEVFDHLVTALVTAARLPEAATSRLAELGQLTRELTWTMEDKRCIVTESCGAAISLILGAQSRNGWSAQNDRARLECVRLLEHALWATRDDLAPHHLAGAIDEERARFERAHLGQLASSERDEWTRAPIASPILDHSKPIAKHIRAFARQNGCMRALTDVAVTIHKGASNRDPALNQIHNTQYNEETLGRCWSIARLLLQPNPSLWDVATKALSYTWTIANLVVKEHALYPRLYQLCFSPDGLLTALLECSDAARVKLGSRAPSSLRRDLIDYFYRPESPYTNSLSFSHPPFHHILHAQMQLQRVLTHSRDGASYFVSSIPMASLMQLLTKREPFLSREVCEDAIDLLWHCLAAHQIDDCRRRAAPIDQTAADQNSDQLTDMRVFLDRHFPAFLSFAVAALLRGTDDDEDDEDEDESMCGAIAADTPSAAHSEKRTLTATVAAAAAAANAAAATHTPSAPNSTPHHDRPGRLSDEARSRIADLLLIGHFAHPDIASEFFDRCFEMRRPLLSSRHSRHRQPPPNRRHTKVSQANGDTSRTDSGNDITRRDNTNTPVRGAEMVREETKELASLCADRDHADLSLSAGSAAMSIAEPGADRTYYQLIADLARIMLPTSLKAKDLVQTESIACIVLLSLLECDSQPTDQRDTDIEDQLCRSLNHIATHQPRAMQKDMVQDMIMAMFVRQTNWCRLLRPFAMRTMVRDGATPTSTSTSVTAMTDHPQTNADRDEYPLTSTQRKECLDAAVARFDELALDAHATTEALLDAVTGLLLLLMQAKGAHSTTSMLVPSSAPIDSVLHHWSQLSVISIERGAPPATRAQRLAEVIAMLQAKDAKDDDELTRFIDAAADATQAREEDAEMKLEHDEVQHSKSENAPSE